MRQLNNHMLLQAQKAGQHVAKPLAGVVTSYDPAHYAAKVQLQPEGITTGWLPVSTLWIGNGWGVYCPPSIGDAVNVYFQEGDIESGWIEGRQFGGSNNPLAVPSGEFWLVHMSGSFLKFLNDGTISSQGNWSHVGSFTATGEVTGNGVVLSQHTHGGVEGGSSNTTAPNPNT